jgi:hypothetical protein
MKTIAYKMGEHPIYKEINRGELLHALFPQIKGQIDRKVATHMPALPVTWLYVSVMN